MKHTLVFGASGMLGHKMLQVLNDEHISVAGTVRSEKVHNFLSDYDIVNNTDAENFNTIKNAMSIIDPDYVVNCIGIVKQLPESNDPIKSHTLNSVFPHQLSTFCRAYGVKMIHISTDCVFDGKRGMYREVDIPNATDIYGRTKFTGEIGEPHLTLRTSIIGRELNSKNGLLEWFLSQRGQTIQGYKNAIFSGVTTIELSHLVADIIRRFDRLEGLYHVASDPISKYDLLIKLNTAYETNTMISASFTEISDRSLNGTKLKKYINYRPPSWDKMIEEMIENDVEYGGSV